MKICTACETPRPLVEFARRVASPDGLAYKCRDCDRAYRSTRAAQYRALRRDSYLRNSEAERAVALARYFDDRAGAIARNREYKESNKEALVEYRRRTLAQCVARTAARRAALDRRTPQWLTKEEYAAIERFYVEARVIRDATGEPVEVDHAIPLRGRTVSGLHVPWNLQLLHALDNRSKDNRL